MYILTPTKIVRAFMIISGKGTTMFSDKIKNGKSIKVWGFSAFDYQDCKEILQKHGFKVKVVYTHTGRTRLWVSM